MYKLEESNNHFIVEIDGLKFVMDTGSEKSLSVDNNITKVVINNEVVNLINTPRVTKEELVELAKMDVSGLIGLDVLNKGFTVDRLKKLVVFGSDNRDLSNAKIINYKGLGFYKATISFLGKKLNVLLDTGAIISYLNINLENLDKAGYFKDYSPLLKKYICGDTYDVMVNTNDTDYLIKLGTPCKELLTVFNILNVDGVLGINSLFNEFARFENNNLYLK